MTEALKSILRHTLSGLAAVLVARLGFNEEQALGIQEAVAVFGSGLLVWGFAKYAPGAFTKRNRGRLPILIVPLAIVLSLALLPSCAELERAGVEIGTYKPVTPGTEGGVFGAFRSLELAPDIEPTITEGK